MEFPIQTEGFENRNLILKAGGFWKGARIWIDGQPAARGPKRGYYLLKRNDGQEVPARFRGFLDPIPPVEIDGRLFHVVEPLKWYQWIWLAWPVLLIFLGGFLGGLLGGGALVTNTRIFRENINGVLKYFVTGVVSVLAVVLFVIIAGSVQLALKK